MTGELQESSVDTVINSIVSSEKPFVSEEQRAAVEQALYDAGLR